ncbi:DNA-binding transcriptional MerR regulator [Hoeflea halophila]|uniref:DNA-binding transcriptional MerR regulator n=1 Tax=Hoeflea halophila TaxID=714899 RepID=A0A286IF91_9HYPH|nr:helix-turn-helix domain-containing protein [Hoeflea halophila]SOE17964.1 DNA-binding transcriptional MerR regulator [Hoeflea halophila]
MFSIGELSKRTGVKIPTIRYYEQMGLIAAPERSEGNQRRYSKDVMQRLSFIRHSRELGFSIEDIKGLLELSQHPEKPCHDAHNLAAQRLEDVQARIAKLQRLEHELKRISECDANTVAHCAVIETLADHSLCETVH